MRGPMFLMTLAVMIQSHQKFAVFDLFHSVRQKFILEICWHLDKLRMDGKLHHNCVIVG